MAMCVHSDRASVDDECTREDYLRLPADSKPRRFRNRNQKPDKTLEVFRIVAKTVKDDDLKFQETLGPGKIYSVWGLSGGMVRTDLGGRTLRVGVLEWPSLMSYDHVTNRYSGYCKGLLLEIAARLNFTYTILQPEDRQWGAMKNGTWNGLVGKLVNMDYDFVVCPLAPTAGRVAAIDFACPLSKVDIGVWILNPKLRNEKWLLLFDMIDLWTCILLLGATVITTALLSFGHAVLSSNVSIERNKHLLYTTEMNLMLVIRSLCKQGSTQLPRTVSGRTVIAFWWWFCIILSVTYSGTIIATLADTRTVFPFNTIDEMLHQDTYTFGTIGNSSLQTYIENSRLPRDRRMLQRIQTFRKTDATVLSPNISHHVQKLQNEKYALVGDLTKVRFTDRKYIRLRELVTSQLECVGLQPNSSLTQPMREVLYEFQTYGLLQALWKKYRGASANSGQVYNPSDSIVVELHMVKSAFYFLLMGIVAGALAVVLERRHRLQRGRKICALHIKGVSL